MKPSTDPDNVRSRRKQGQRMFGDYPITNPGYWFWLGGSFAIFFFSLLLMFAVKE